MKLTSKRKRQSIPSLTENIARVLAECLGYPVMPGNTMREEIDPGNGVVLCVAPMSMVTVWGLGSTWGLIIGNLDDAPFVILEGEQLPDKIASALAVADKELDGLISQVLTEYIQEYADEDPEEGARADHVLKLVQRNTQGSWGGDSIANSRMRRIGRTCDA